MSLSTSPPLFTGSQVIDMLKTPEGQNNLKAAVLKTDNPEAALRKITIAVEKVFFGQLDQCGGEWRTGKEAKEYSLISKELNDCRIIFTQLKNDVESSSVTLCAERNKINNFRVEYKKLGDQTSPDAIKYKIQLLELIGENRTDKEIKLLLNLKKLNLKNLQNQLESRIKTKEIATTTTTTSTTENPIEYTPLYESTTVGSPSRVIRRTETISEDGLSIKIQELYEGDNDIVRTIRIPPAGNIKDTNNGEGDNEIVCTIRIPPAGNIKDTNNGEGDNTEEMANECIIS